jgi:hypothetical protein
MWHNTAFRLDTEGDEMRIANLRFLALGTLLGLLGVLPAIALLLVSNHAWYWSAAPVWCIVVMLASASGGFLVARSMGGTSERRPWLMVPGGILGLVWCVSGISAFGLAFAGMLLWRLPGGLVQHHGA